MPIRALNDAICMRASSPFHHPGKTRSMTKTLTRRIARPEARKKHLGRFVRHVMDTPAMQGLRRAAYTDIALYGEVSDETLALKNKVIADLAGMDIHTSRIRFEDGTEATAEVITTQPMVEGTFEVA